jgi:hypothetical protein
MMSHSNPLSLVKQIEDTRKEILKHEEKLRVAPKDKRGETHDYLIRLRKSLKKLEAEFESH